jgi:hypothetical protein
MGHARNAACSMHPAVHSLVEMLVQLETAQRMKRNAATGQLERKIEQWDPSLSLRMRQIPLRKAAK